MGLVTAIGNIAMFKAQGQARSSDARSGVGSSVCRCLVFAALSFSIAAFGQAPTKCTVLDPQLQGSYVGDCKDGYAEGQGEARGTAQYKGGFKAGRKHGKGVKTWPSGDRYEGDFAEDRKHGQGTYTWGLRSASAGEKYSGAWLDDKRNGYGIYEWPNGDRYAGPWKNDAIAGPPTKGMIARARAESELAAAVGTPGSKVCREMQVGIATRDLVRGTVVARDGEKLRIRIDDPGRFHQMIGEGELAKGDVVSDFMKHWTPCM